MHELIMKIISNQLDIKLGQFTQELNSVLRKIYGIVPDKSILIWRW